MSKVIDNKYEIGEEIYLKTDDEQLRRIVFAFVVTKDSVLYRCCCGVQVSDHYDFELSKTKNYTTSRA